MKIMLIAFLSLVNTNAFDLSGMISKGTSMLGGSQSSSANSPTSLSALSSGEISQGLKQALSKGIDASIEQLGQKDGFYGDQLVRILMPEDLQTVVDLVRKAGGEKYVDDFVLSMNRAAEQSVTKVVPIFSTALTNMSIEDAKKILTSGDNAATEYFKGRTSKEIQDTVKPIIQNSMQQNSVYNYYGILKDYYDRLGGSSLLGSVLSPELSAVATSLGSAAIGQPKFMSKEELDGYMSAKTSDGLFALIAEQEKKIRNNIGARSTPLLKKVFGAIQ